MTLKLGVPSKGRLMEQSFDWFGRAWSDPVRAPGPPANTQARSMGWTGSNWVLLLGQ